MNRRKFVTLLLVCLNGRAISCTAALSIAPATVNNTSRRFRPPFAALFERSESARAVGHRFLAEYPGSFNPDKLLARLGAQLLDKDMPDEVALKHRVAQLQQREFAEGDTVIVSNWILSRTEAELCAYLALN